jgi:hypothetical protein
MVTIINFQKGDIMKMRALAILTAVIVLFAGSGQAWAGSEGDTHYNVWYGLEAGSAGMTGSYNSFFGRWAGNVNSSGDNNTFIGYRAGYENTTGTGNSFIGDAAGYHNSSGQYNSFLGYGAGQSNTTSSHNSFIGYLSGNHNTTGHHNSFIGNYSGYSNITGTNNVFIGVGAGYNETGSNKLYIDNCSNSATPCTSEPLIYGEFDSRMVRVDGSFVANGAIQSTVGGIRFPDGTTQLTRGVPGIVSSSLTSIGEGAGENGKNNTFLGYLAGHSNESGGGNVFIGDASGYANATGFANTYVGSGAGHSSTGSNNVFIGYYAGYAEDGDNKLYISNSNTTEPLIYGEFDNKIVRINGMLTFPSDERLKKNIEPLKTSLDKIMNLKGVSYEWKDEKGFGRGKYIGLIAQDVEAVFPELVRTDTKGYKSLSYEQIVPALVEAIKEQQATIRTLTERLSRLEKVEAGSNRPGGKDVTAQK